MPVQTVKEERILCGRIFGCKGSPVDIGREPGAMDRSDCGYMMPLYKGAILARCMRVMQTDIGINHISDQVDGRPYN